MNLFGNYTGIVVLILLVLVAVLFIMLIMQNSRIRDLDDRLFNLTAGSDGDSLEDTLVKILDTYDGMNSRIEQNTGDIRDIYRRLHFAVQKYGIVKYDAFTQMGGSLSSVIVLLDQDNNGILINTVQNTDGCYSYVKEIRKGRSDVEYTEEEQEAVDQAINSGPKAQSRTAKPAASSRPAESRIRRR